MFVLWWSFIVLIPLLCLTCASEQFRELSKKATTNYIDPSPEHTSQRPKEAILSRKHKLVIITMSFQLHARTRLSGGANLRIDRARCVHSVVPPVHYKQAQCGTKRLVNNLISSRSTDNWSIIVFRYNILEKAYCKSKLVLW